MTNTFVKVPKSTGLLKVSACASALLASFLMFAPMMASSAKATDVAASVGTSSDRFVKLGLNRSVVVHLPSDVKDVVAGNSDIVDAVVRNKNTAYLFARGIGQTNIFFFDAHGQQILNLSVDVGLDVTGIQNLIQRSMPGSHITVDTANDNIILGGTVMNPLEAKTAEDLATQMLPGGKGKVVNTIKIAGEDQVMLQVRVVEVQRDVLKQFGINFKALLSVGSLAFNVSNVNPFANGLISPDQGFAASGVSGASNFSGIVRAMESDGLVRTLAEPNLTALSGQAATFHAGGEFPYNVCTSSTSGTSCTTNFKDYGVSLNFTPIVLSQGRINLKIHSDVSELSSVSTGSSVPALNSRSADTTLELPDGGSMMLAGLISETTRSNVSGTPGLKSLPVLGALFRSRDFVNNQTELVVIVTPHIVRSLAQKQLQSPDENYEPASDRQTLLLGRLNKVYGSSARAPQGSYKGNVGYIVE